MINVAHDVLSVAVSVFLLLRFLLVWWFRMMVASTEFHLSMHVTLQNITTPKQHFYLLLFGSVLKDWNTVKPIKSQQVIVSSFMLCAQYHLLQIHIPHKDFRFSVFPYNGQNSAKHFYLDLSMSHKMMLPSCKHWTGRKVYTDFRQTDRYFN